MKAKRPTSVDVAREAGVSQSTVSLVLSGKDEGRVTANKREVVLQAAVQLGYQPNTAARALKLGRMRMLAIIVPMITHPFFAATVQAAERIARRKGYAVMLVDAGDDPDQEAELVNSLAGYAVDGLVIWSIGGGWRKASPSALKRTIVIVDGDRPITPSVFINADSGTRAAVAHLLSLGHTRIGHLATRSADESFRVRGRAYRVALQEAGLGLRHDYEQATTYHVDACRQAAITLLKISDPPTAILCDDDLHAPGVYKASLDLGLRIPNDLSVMGISDIDLARMLEPELTTLRIPVEQVAEAAIELLLGVIEGKPATHIEIPLEVMVRRSTAPVRKS